MRIRHATDHEFDRAAAGMDGGWLGAACVRLRRLVEDQWCRVLVAEEHGELIAVLGLVLHPPGSGRSTTATIRELRVHPYHLHRGIGSRLVRFAEGIARINGCRKVEVPHDLVAWGDGRCWPGLGYEDPGAGLHKVFETCIQGSSG